MTVFDASRTRQTTSQIWHDCVKDSLPSGTDRCTWTYKSHSHYAKLAWHCWPLNSLWRMMHWVFGLSNHQKDSELEALNVYCIDVAKTNHPFNLDVHTTHMLRYSKIYRKYPGIYFSTTISFAVDKMCCDAYEGWWDDIYTCVCAIKIYSNHRPIIE